MAVESTAATAPKIPPHMAISRRTSRLRMYPRGAGTTRTPPTPLAAETLGASKENQKARASLVSSGPRTNRETFRQHPLSPTDLLTLKDDHYNHSHLTVTKQATLLGRCKVLPSPTQVCRAKGRPLLPRMAEAMVVPVPQPLVEDNPMVKVPHQRPRYLCPLTTTTIRLVQRMVYPLDVKMVPPHPLPRAPSRRPQACSAAEECRRLQLMVRTTLTLLT